MVINVATFLYEDGLQLHVVILALVISFAAHTVYLPFDVADLENGGQLLHRLERNSMLVLILLLWSANVFVIGNKMAICDSFPCTFLVVCVFISNIVFVFQGVRLFLHYFVQRNTTTLKKIKKGAQKAKQKASNKIKSTFTRSSSLKNNPADQSSSKKQKQKHQRGTSLFASRGSLKFSNPMGQPGQSGQQSGQQSVGGQHSSESQKTQMSVPRGTLNHHRDPTVELSTTHAGTTGFAREIEMSSQQQQRDHHDDDNDDNNDIIMHTRGQQHHQRNSTELPEGWDREYDDDGEKYYVDSNTATSHWELPSSQEVSTKRSSTDDIAVGIRD